MNVKKRTPLVVVFDFFGVMVAEGMSISQTLYERVRGHIAYEPLWSTYLRLTTGRAGNEEFWRLASPPGRSWRSFQNEFFGMLTPEPGLPAIVRRLRRMGARLAILSEIPDEWLPPLLKRLGVSGQFDVTVTSGRAGVTKPDPAIYRLLLRELGRPRPGERRFYIDDRLANLAAGEKIGLQSIWLRRPGGAPGAAVEFRPRHILTRLADVVDIAEAGAVGPDTFSAARAAVVHELGRSAAEVNERSAERLVEMILAAQRVFVYGRGRTGLATWAFASRLAQLGLDVHVVGEMTAPAISPGDLLVAASGTGTTRTTLLAAAAARRIGARVAALTAHPRSRLGRAADLVVDVSGATRRRASGEERSAQYGGSLFEQTLLLTFDAVAMVLKRRLARSDGEMDSRHANLE